MQQQYKLECAGVLPFFPDGTVLLGKEYRKRYNTYNWMEFGGKKEGNETRAETACREANEETAFTLNITLNQVKEAEDKNSYIDFHNPATGVFYRMYCVDFTFSKPPVELFKQNAVGKSNVEMIEWKYFNKNDVINNIDGMLPNTDTKLYSTFITRLDLLRVKLAN